MVPHLQSLLRNTYRSLNLKAIIIETGTEVVDTLVANLLPNLNKTKKQTNVENHKYYPFTNYCKYTETTSLDIIHSFTNFMQLKSRNPIS